MYLQPKHLFFLLLFVCISCNNDHSRPNEDEFVLQGQIYDAPQKPLIISEITPKGIIPLDTIYTDKDGRFFYKQQMPEQTLYELIASPNSFCCILPQVGEIIEVRGGYEDLSTTYITQNSPETTLLWELNQENLKHAEVINRIQEVWHDNKYTDNAKDLKKSLDSLYFSTFNTYRSAALAFINKNHGSLATCVALYKTLARQPLFRIQNDLNIYEFVLAGLIEKHPDSPHTSSLQSLIEKQKTLAIMETIDNKHDSSK